MARSLIRAAQMEEHDSFSFAQLIIDGYSGGDVQDGYLTGIILETPAGTDTLIFHADDGEIDQQGSGPVHFTGNVTADNNVVIQGDLTVNGTTTTIDTEQMIVTDPITVINASGSEASSDWTGFSARDTDGYNRFGWVFAGGAEDGYWAISIDFTDVSQPDANPTRALAYVGEGDAYGDLSSTIDGDSGANKIAVTPIAGLLATDVQEALEEINAAVTGASDNTTNIDFTINSDATAGVDEDPCLIMKGGDGTSLIEGYLCVITDSVNGDRFEFRLYEDAVDIDRDLHLGPRNDTSNVDSCVTFNSGNGSIAYQARICLDGDQNRLEFTGAGAYSFDEYAQFLNDVAITGDLDAYGSVNLGNSVAGDTLNVQATIVSDLLPTDCTYMLGDPTQTWLDGYFCFFDPTYYTPVGDAYSLQGHLKGIDAALADSNVDHPRGVYEITVPEASADELDSSRTPDQGDTVDVSTLTDAEFRDNIFVYWNGQLLYNDPSPAVDTGSVVNDVARQSGSLSDLLFAGNLKTNAVIQIVDMR